MYRFLIPVALLLPLAGCEDAKSVEYFMEPENREERKEVVLSCLTNGKVGEICDNAATAERRAGKIEYQKKLEAQEAVGKAASDVIRSGGN